MRAVAAALALTGRFDRATDIALDIGLLQEKSKAWAVIAGTLARAGRWDDAEQMAVRFPDGPRYLGKHLIASPAEYQVQALVAVAVEVAASHPRRARKLLINAEQIARTIPAPEYRQATDKANAVAGIADALGELDPQRAKQVARDAEKLVPHVTSVQAQAASLEAVMDQLAEASPLPDHAPGETADQEGRYFLDLWYESSGSAQVAERLITASGQDSSERGAAQDSQAHRLRALAIAGERWYEALPVIARLHPADAVTICDTIQKRLSR